MKISTKANNVNLPEERLQKIGWINHYQSSFNQYLPKNFIIRFINLKENSIVTGTKVIIQFPFNY